MKIKTLLYSTLLIVGFLQQGYSQKSQVAAANKKYDNNAYVDAIATYERIAAKGYKDEKMFQKLGNAYYFNAELPKAAQWYGELFAMNKEQDPEYCYRYAQCLKSIGNYDKANEMMDQFNKKSGNDKRAKLYADNKNYLEEIKANSGHFTVSDAGINSEYSDYGSTLLGNKLIFASSRVAENNSSKVFEQTNQSFTDIYASEILPNGKLDAPKQFGGKEINSKFHESTPVFSKDGKTVYFTRNNFLDGKKGKDDEKITRLKLYKATLTGDSWGNVIELPFNNNNYSIAHPALSPDGKTLYFASDMSGTLGQSDLYKVAIQGDSFGKPVNLGSAVNTEGRESFPFVSPDNKLYFATDGRPGLGGFDIFVAPIEQDGTISKAQNVGAPINSSQDDFAMIIDQEGKGFFSSNRAGGKGFDDIYKLSEIICKQQIEGLITDMESKIVLPNAKVSLFNEKFELQKESISYANGHYSFEAVCGKSYYVRVQAEDYVTKENKVIVSTTDGTTSFPVALEKAGCKVVVGGDLAKCFGIKVIYFALNKSEITKEAAFELEKILDVMKQNPTMKIDVRSYTDSRQTAKYNEVLSEKRAKATMEWLVKNGVDASILTGKGYGESQLVNQCADGVKCSEEEHQANRRSEFIVVSME
ncbi:flagellar motor protein MotB [Flavobacterium alvei]|uniref:Flagellar motor protein MotB n=1 Tax=Flavobacterium alvei TaxID=2080416 RepID=A0A2S5AB36_9FLAO|nr:OmpA family protein [Flavobacterium alvei]POY39447.1 flagellar motor protein MotB [Flavobacterium alvei]